MLIRPLELCWNEYQRGVSIFSFGFPDDTYYSALAVIYLADVKGWWLSIGFKGWLIGTTEEEMNNYED